MNEGEVLARESDDGRVDQRLEWNKRIEEGKISFYQVRSGNPFPQREAAGVPANRTERGSDDSRYIPSCWRQRERRRYFRYVPSIPPRKCTSPNLQGYSYRDGEWPVSGVPGDARATKELTGASPTTSRPRAPWSQSWQVDSLLVEREKLRSL